MQRIEVSHIDQPAFFDANVYTYALAAQTRDGAIIQCNHVATAQGLAEGILAFLNPLYAHMQVVADHRNTSWEVHPLHHIDPSNFIATHNYVLRVSLCYGFAAAGNRIVLTEQDRTPRGLIGTQQFPVPPHVIKRKDFVRYDFKGFAHVEDIYTRSRIDGYYDKVRAMRSWAVADMQNAAKEALACADFCEPTDEFTHTALYDVEKRRWDFVPFRPRLVK